MSNIQCIKSSIISPPFALPDGWTWYKWGDLVVGYEQGLIRSNLDLVDQGTFYFKMHNIAESGFCNYDKREFTKASDDEIRKYSVSNGDFLINVRNSYELVGKTCVVSNIPAKSTYNHMIIKVIHVDNRLNYYINALFSKTFWRKYIEACRKGTTTVIALYKDDLLNIPIPIPPEYVFNEIYELEKAFIEKRTKNLLICSKLESMAKTLYDYWFTQFDFPNEEGKPYRWSGGTMEWNEQLKREIPKGWNVCELSQLCETKLGGTPDTSVNEYWDGDIPWLSSAEVAQSPILFSQKNITAQGMDCSTTSFAKKGAVLLSITRYIRPAILGIDACFNQSVVAIIPNNLYRTEYIYQFILSQIKRYMTLRTGAQQPHINKEVVDKTFVVCPPEDILMKYYDAVEHIYRLHMNKAKEIYELTKLRDWLLPMLMNGQATVE